MTQPCWPSGCRRRPGLSSTACAQRRWWRQCSWAGVSQSTGPTSTTWVLASDLTGPDLRPAGALEVAVLAAVERDGAGDADYVARGPDQPLRGSRARVVPEQRDAAGAVGRRLDQQAGAARGQHPVVAVGVRHRDQLDRAAGGLPVDVQYAARPGGLQIQPAGQPPG